MTDRRLSVRGATVDDLGVLSKLLTYLHGAPPWSSAADQQATQILEAIVADPMRMLALGSIGDSPAGAIDVIVSRNMTRDLRSFAIIENLVVAPTEREAGLGRALMEAALAFARDLGCYKVQLVSANRRDAAHRLYVSTGFDADVSGFRRYLVDVD